MRVRAWWPFPLEEVLLTGDPLKGSLSRLVLFGSRARLESLRYVHQLSLVSAVSVCFLFSALSCDAKNILYSPCSSAVPRRRSTCCCRHCSSPPLLYYSTNTYVIIYRAPGWGGNQISPGQTCRPFVTPRRARVSAFVPHWAPCSTLAFPHVS